MGNLHPTFAAILKPHLQGQRVVRRRDLDRYKALSAVHAELELAGAVIAIDQLDWAVSEVTNRLHEASLDRQFAEAQARSQESLDKMRDALTNLRKAEAPDGELGERERRRLAENDDLIAEREERRQYRDWRNDSGV